VALRISRIVFSALSRGRGLCAEVRKAAVDTLRTSIRGLGLSYVAVIQ
jgi:hypothetical protein